jgi:hypothetical protein
MLADLDLLLIAVFCTADDLLPEPSKNARRILADAEVVTLAVAQAIMGITSDARFIRTARKQLAHLFPVLPNRAGYLKRRQRLSETIEWLMTVFASDSPGFHDDLVLVDSTPVECARSVETTRRSQLADAADYGYCTSHSRYFWGFRLHGLFALDGTPNATSAWHCSPAASDPVACAWSVTKATPAARSRLPLASSTPPSSGRAVKTNPRAGSTSLRSGNASNRSSKPAKTSSRLNATAPAPSTASPPASRCASLPSQPQSLSTTASAGHPAPSPTTRPEPVELLI